MFFDESKIFGCAMICAKLFSNQASSFCKIFVYSLATSFFFNNHKNLNKYRKVESHPKTICVKLFSNPAKSFNKNIFFSFAMATRIFKRGPPRVIPVKLVKFLKFLKVDWEIFGSKLLMDRRCTS